MFAAVYHEQCHLPKFSNWPQSQTPISQKISPRTPVVLLLFFFFFNFILLNQHLLFLLECTSPSNDKERGAIYCYLQELHGNCRWKTVQEEYQHALWSFPTKKKNSKDLSQRKVLNDSLGLFIVSMYWIVVLCLDKLLTR